MNPFLQAIVVVTVVAIAAVNNNINDYDDLHQKIAKRSATELRQPAGKQTLPQWQSGYILTD